MLWGKDVHEGREFVVGMEAQGETELPVCEAGLRQWQSAMRTVSKTIWSRV